MQYTIHCIAYSMSEIICEYFLNLVKIVSPHTQELQQANRKVHEENYTNAHYNQIP